MSSEAPVGYGRRHVGISLRTAYETFIGQVFERLASQGFDDLRPAHAQVFQNLREEGVRLTELARAADITPQSMATLVDDLERFGYVTREPDARDRRASLIRPTARGKSEVRAARKIISDLEAQWERRVGKKRFADLLDTLQSLNGLFERPR